MQQRHIGRSVGFFLGLSKLGDCYCNRPHMSDCKEGFTSCILLFFCTAGSTQTCPIRVKSAANVPLHNISVQSPFLPDGACIIDLLDPAQESTQCVASVDLTAEDFVRSWIFMNGNVTTDDAAAAVTFNTSVDLHVTRVLAVEVKPHFKLPSKPPAAVLWLQVGCMRVMT